MTPEDDEDEDEFQELLAGMNAKLEKRTGSVRDAKEMAKKHRDNPELATVKACIADRESGREDPSKSPLWAQGLVN